MPSFNNPNKYLCSFHIQTYSVPFDTTALYSLLPFIQKVLLCLEVRRLYRFTLLITVVFNSSFLWGIWQIIMNKGKLKDKVKTCPNANLSTYTNIANLCFNATVVGRWTEINLLNTERFNS